MENCLFCKIIKGEAPSQNIYEDEGVFAFLDINPVNPGHILVVPKEHCETLLDCSAESLKKLIVAVPKIAKAMMNALNYESFNLGVNNGSIAGQLVNHLHFHIMPRKEGDMHKLFAGAPATPEELSEVGDKIRSVL